jgi:hypothetical protein
MIGDGREFWKAAQSPHFEPFVRQIHSEMFDLLDYVAGTAVQTV